MLLIAYLIDLIHFLGLLFPLYMFFIPVNYLKFLFRYIFLLSIMTPIGWGLFDNCWIDCALGNATGVYHVSKFISSVRTISSPDIIRITSSSTSCTYENDFSGIALLALKLFGRSLPYSKSAS